jgi:hypothetical protein
MNSDVSAFLCLILPRKIEYRGETGKKKCDISNMKISLFLLLFPQISEIDLLTFVSQSEDAVKILDNSVSSSIQTLLAE